MCTNLYQTVLCQNQLKKGVPYQVLVVCPGNFATEHNIKLYQKLEFLRGWERGGGVQTKKNPPWEEPIINWSTT